MTSITAARQTHQSSDSWRRPFAQEPTLLHEFFEKSARRWPRRTAVDTPPGPDRPERRTITYAELDRQSNALAHFLREFVKEECVVAILLPRNSEHLYVAQLAILKAGAAYTCIDPVFPDEQVDIILNDSQAVAVLADAAGTARVRRVQPDIECALDVIDWIDRLQGPVQPVEPASWLTPSSLAYVIYTSGTTGRPKGVMIEHGSVINLIQGDLQELAFTPQDRIAQNSSSAYDSSVEEVWMAFASGTTLVVTDDETIRLGPDLIPWLRKERITVLCPTPTLLRTTGCDNPAKDLPGLRLVYVGGEALPTDVAERWAPGRCLLNDYGPTECTVSALRGQIEPGAAVTIGRAIPGLQAWVLNEALEEIEDGAQGELCLGGAGLARGYMNEPELTARKFPLHPRLGRIYRTGDLVHRGADGNFFCHGRIDSQVKVRGYRIELEAIETRIAECAGVREAACRVQGEGAQQKIVAFVVPENGDTPVSFDDLKSYLHQVLPEYMVPTWFGLLATLPTTMGGKLNRKALPVLEAHVHEVNGHVLAPRNPMEEKLASAFQKILGMSEPVSVEDDFFNDLGGDSLLAAQLISKLRDDAATAALTVRCLYEARTVAELAKYPAAYRLADGSGEPSHEHHRTALLSRPVGERLVGNPILATIFQTLWLVLGLLLGAPLAYVMTFHVLPALTETLGLVGLLLLSPFFFFAGLLCYAFLSAVVAVLAKKLLIGRYRPLRAPVWGSFYVCNWMVQQTVRIVPWWLLEGTVFQQMVLRALGARIGRRVHIHRGVNLLQGGWDLLEIGDDVTLSQDASLRLVELEAAQVVVGPITLRAGSTLDIRAGVAGNTCLEENASLTALSFLIGGGTIPQGERWDGVPAKPAGRTSQSGLRSQESGVRGQGLDFCLLNPDSCLLTPGLHGLAMILGRIALGAFIALPAEALALVFALVYGMDTEGVAELLFNPSPDAWMVLLGTALVILSVPLTLVFQVIALRAMGRVPEGVISRWSLAYVRVWLKTGIVESASHWLSGTLLWPVWLRWAGMKLGRGCEISTIIDTIPELVEMGAETFLADGIYLGGPRIHQGTVTLAPVRLGKNTFLGNHALVAAGQTLPDDILLGVCTVADDTKVRSGTSWFGHPPFELPNREVVAADRSLTHDPTLVRYLSRVSWELLRFALPLAPVLLALVWLNLLAQAEEAVSLPVLLVGVVPALEFGFLASLCLLVLALKWILLGRVRPGMHALYSCWCSRWDFHYVVWDIFGLGPLSALEGTLLLNWYLRAMGMRIGRHVVLGQGFAHVVDPDMLEFEDGATVSCQFQAHTFEDRVLKIDYVLIRRQATAGSSAVLLYGADIGDRTNVIPHSVVMKRERLLADRTYAGCPTRVLS